MLFAVRFLFIGFLFAGFLRRSFLLGRLGFGLLFLRFLCRLLGLHFFVKLNKALYKLAKSMITKDMSFVTLISGEDVSDEDAAAAVEMLESKFADQVDITYIKGDQPVYYYIFSVE